MSESEMNMKRSNKKFKSREKQVLIPSKTLKLTIKMKVGPMVKSVLLSHDLNLTHAARRLKLLWQMDQGEWQKSTREHRGSMGKQCKSEQLMSRKWLKGSTREHMGSTGEQRESTREHKGSRSTKWALVRKQCGGTIILKQSRII